MKYQTFAVAKTLTCKHNILSIIHYVSNSDKKKRLFIMFLIDSTYFVPWLPLKPPSPEIVFFHNFLFHMIALEDITSHKTVLWDMVLSFV